MQIPFPAIESRRATNESVGTRPVPPSSVGNTRVTKTGEDSFVEDDSFYSQFQSAVQEQTADPNADTQADVVADSEATGTTAVLLPITAGGLNVAQRLTVAGHPDDVEVGDELLHVTPKPRNQPVSSENAIVVPPTIGESLEAGSLEKLESADESSKTSDSTVVGENENFLGEFPEFGLEEAAPAVRADVLPLTPNSDESSLRLNTAGVQDETASEQSLPSAREFDRQTQTTAIPSAVPPEGNSGVPDSTSALEQSEQPRFVQEPLVGNAISPSEISIANSLAPSNTDGQQHVSTTQLGLTASGIAEATSQSIQPSNVATQDAVDAAAPSVKQRFTTGEQLASAPLNASTVEETSVGKIDASTLQRRAAREEIRDNVPQDRTNTPAAETSANKPDAAAWSPLDVPTAGVLNVPELTIDDRANLSVRSTNTLATTSPTHSDQSKALTSQVATAIDRAIETNARPLRLRLDPPELGSIAVEIRRDAGQVQIEIRFESTAALRLARDGVDGLRESLAAKGIDVDADQIRLQIDIGRDAKVSNTNATGDQPDHEQDTANRQRQEDGRSNDRAFDDRESSEKDKRQSNDDTGQNIPSRDNEQRRSTSDTVVGRYAVDHSRSIDLTI